MRKIDISGINSLFERSMLFFLNKIYEIEYTHNDQSISDFIDMYLMECPKNLKKELLAQSQVLKDIEFVDKMIESYQIGIDNKEKKEILEDFINDFERGNYKFFVDSNILLTAKRKIQELWIPDELELFSANSLLYNICGVLIDFDKLEGRLDNYMDAIETKCYEEAIIEVTGIIDNIIMIENAVTSYILDMYMDNIMDFSEHYRLQPEISFYLTPHKKILSIYDTITKLQPSDVERQEGIYYSQVIPLCYDVAVVRKKLDVLKVVLAFICIIRSPEYKGTWKQLSKLLLNLFRDILYKGTIHKVYLQTKKLEGKEVTRGSSDGTTRIQFIFSLSNSDVYVLRIDMPHKGKLIMHLNIEEVYGDSMLATGFPLRLYEEDYNKLVKYPQEIIDKLFWEIDERLWFRTNYLGIIKNIDMKEDEKDFLKNLFEKQSHKEIELPFEYDEMDILQFFEKVNEYLMRFRLTGLVCMEFGKDVEKISSMIYHIKNGRRIYNDFVNKADIIYNVPCDYSQVIWEIYGEMGLKANKITEESLKMCDMKEKWRLIEQYCVI